MPRTGSVCGSGCLLAASPDERFLRAHDAELVSLRVGKDSPGLSAGLADAGPARPEPKKAVNLLSAVRGAAGAVKMHPVLDRLGVGDRHEAHADGSVLAGPDDRSRARTGPSSPAPGSRTGPGRADRERQRRCGVVGRACRQYARHAEPYPGNPAPFPGGLPGGDYLPEGRSYRRSGAAWSRHFVAPAASGYLTCTHAAMRYVGIIDSPAGRGLL